MSTFPAKQFVGFDQRDRLRRHVPLKAKPAVAEARKQSSIFHGSSGFILSSAKVKSPHFSDDKVSDWKMPNSGAQAAEASSFEPDDFC